VTFTLELDLYKVKLNQQANYLGRRSFGFKVIIRTYTDGHRHTEPIALYGPLKLWVRTACLLQ